MLFLNFISCNADSRPAEPVRSPSVQTEAPAPSARATAIPTSTPIPRRKLTVSLKGLANLIPVPSLPASFAPAKPEPSLQELITKTLEGTEGTYSVVVHHLVDGRYASLEPDYIYHTASLFKLAVLAAAYRERDAGRLDFERLLVIEDFYVEYDLGTLALLGLEPEDRVSVEDAIKAMIVVSDTSLALMVQDAAGAGRVRDLVEAEGLTNTSLPKPPLLSTAADMVRLLEIIASGSGFTAESREEMLSLLLQERTFSGIGAGVPDGIPVANKTGNWGDATHDVAIVWGPSGPYLLAVLSDRAWEWEPTARLSQAVYEYFNGEPNIDVPQATEGPVSTPTQQVAIATQSVLTPTQQVATPTQIIPTPTQPVVTPIKSTPTLTKPVATPTPAGLGRQR